MKRLVIAIDCDDVLVPTANGIIDFYNTKYGTKLTLAHMYKPASLRDWGTDDDDVAIERINQFLLSDDHAQIVPLKEAIEAVQALATVHELHLITGRADFLAELTKHTIENHFPGCFLSIEHTNFVVTSTNAEKRRTKGEVCRTIGADMLIDDHLDHCKNVIESGIKDVVLFGDYPWNQATALPDGIVRCRDWSSVTQEVARAARY